MARDKYDNLTVDVNELNLELDIEQYLNEIGIKTASSVRAKAPVDKRSVARKGRYRRNIAYKVDLKSGAVRIGVIAPDYRLAHLLEFGHRTKNGGHTAPQPHFEDGYKQMTKLSETLANKIKIKEQ